MYTYIHIYIYLLIALPIVHCFSMSYCNRLQLLDGLIRTRSKKLDAAIGAFVDMNGLAMHSFLTTLLDVVVGQCEAIMVSVASQVLWAFGYSIEKQLLIVVQSKLTRSITHADLCSAGGDGCAMKEDSKIYDMKHPARVLKALDRYMRSTQLANAGSLHFSMAGPDGTKVGTDLSLFAGAIVSSKARKVAVCPPQVFQLVAHRLHYIVLGDSQGLPPCIQIT